MMTVEEAVEYLESERSAAMAQARAMKDPNWPLARLKSLYRAAKPDDRGSLNEAICGWLRSDDSDKWYDAIYLIDEFSIAEALDDLRALQEKIEQRQDHEAPYDWSMINDAIGRMVERE